MSRLVIFLHGVGSRGADLAPLEKYLAPALPETAFEAPDGPMRFDQGGSGRQWFSVSGVTEANRPARIAAARPAFDAVLADLIERHDLTGKTENVALVGFSQGTIMALDAVASGRWTFGAIVGFSGRLATPDPISPSRLTKILLVHGTADPVIPASESESARERLAAAGVDVALELQPGLAHTINGEGIARAIDHLSKAF